MNIDFIIMYISKRGHGYVVVDNYLTSDEIDNIMRISATKQYEDSKIGTTVNKDKKRRKDCFLYRKECDLPDQACFERLAPVIETELGISVCFRERWKIGHYSGTDNGFYNAHTDTQGPGDTMCYRKISVVVALSHPTEYVGGNLLFPTEHLAFRLNRGSAILFRSEMFHGVTPVTEGDRYVLISFLFDQAGGIHKLKYAPSLADYIPRCDLRTLAVRPFLNMREYQQLVSYTGVTHEDAHSGATPLPIPTTESTSVDSVFSVNRVVATEASTSAEVAFASHSHHQPQQPTYILPLLPDSGPGNQIVSIKEALIMSHYLGCTCMLPPICQHYTRGMTSSGEPLFWQFEDIFSYSGNDGIYLSKATTESETEPAIREVNRIFCFHGAYHGKCLKAQRWFGLGETETETEILVEKRRFRSEADYTEVRNYATSRNSIMCIKHLFNNTAISTCSMNGCMECPMNPAFEPLYARICAQLDFAPTIKQYGNHFIQTHLTRETPPRFIAVHMRYPDVMGTRTLADFAGYDESAIDLAIKQFKDHLGLTDVPVFVATNNPRAVRRSALRNHVLYQTSDISLSSVCSLPPQAESFIEQYICTQAEFFIMSPYNDYSKKDEPHQRSTWSSFIKDYRKYNRCLEHGRYEAGCISLAELLIIESLLSSPTH